jgi:hypothetical protein
LGNIIKGGNKMGVSYDVKGVRDLDKKFSNMAKVKKACDDAGVGYPREVEDFFEEFGSDNSIEYLKSVMENFDIDFKDTSGDGEVIYEVNLSDLPGDTKAIKFIIGY